MLARLVANAPDGRIVMAGGGITAQTGQGPGRRHSWCPRSMCRRVASSTTGASPSPAGMLGVTAGPEPRLADQRLAGPGHRAPRADPREPRSTSRRRDGSAAPPGRGPRPRRLAWENAATSTAPARRATATRTTDWESP